MDNLIKKFAILDIRRINKENFTKKLMRHRITNYAIEINTSFTRMDYEKIESISKNIISQIFIDFKNKKKSQIVTDFQ